MRTTNKFALLIGVGLILLPVMVFAKCEVQEVVEMVEGKMSTKMIKNACKKSVDVPDCTLSKVVRLARQGQDENKIYIMCENEVIPDHPHPEPVNENNPELSQHGMPRGSVLQMCGCWGFVNIGEQDRTPKCQSGWAEAVACDTFCPAGGVQWGIRCL